LRWVALAVGAVLVGIAFFAGSRVADTREGLIYEAVALLAGLAGVGLVLYGWVAPAALVHRTTPRPPLTPPPPVRVRTANDLLLGGGGLVIAIALVAGIGLSAGFAWAVMGLVLLLPTIAGSAYLCLRFLSAPQREWRIDLRRLMRLR
jgi:hypothetical protein